MRTALFSENEREMVNQFLETGDKGDDFRVLVYRARRHYPLIKEDFDLLGLLLERVEPRINEMKAVPTNWMETLVVNEVKYGCDGDYNIWNLNTEEKIFSEHGTEEIDLRDVLRGEVMWENSDEKFTFRDFLAEVLEIF